MPTPRSFWHPVTRQRWRRFRNMKRGWWAFWLLCAAYGISLFSEWIANDKPLCIRYEGKTYFPILRFYPEDAFLDNGRQTRPDYKALQTSDRFTSNPANQMRWPLIPYGPMEILNPTNIILPDRITVTARPEARVAALDVDAAGAIIRLMGDAAAFPSAATGTILAAAWRLPDDFTAALQRRFANQSAPEGDWMVERADGTGAAWLSLSPFEPRSGPPARVRVTVRENLAHAVVQKAVVDEAHPVWPPGFPPPGTDGWQHDTSKEKVRFPFRPVAGHPLGIDSSGRDVAARMLYALRTSISFGLFLVLGTMILGTLAGAAQGYYGGRADLFGQRLTEIWESLPAIYVLILLGAIYGRSFGLLLVLYTLFNWVGISYYMRAEFLRLRRQPFVEAARTIGLPDRKIIFRHILPNALVPLVTFFPFSLVGAIGAMAALDYLGFGLPPPTPSWGELLSQAQEFTYAWWLVLYPTLALFAVMLAGVFVGEGLRAAFDPKQYGRME